VKSLLASRETGKIGRVLWANGIAAIGLGIVPWVRFDLPLGIACAVVALVFVALFLCLLFRYTVWIPACLGGLVFASAPALILAGVAQQTHPALRWVGGAAGFALGFGIAVWMYARVGKIAQSNR
jgi:uncharacterized membrane protein